MGILILICVPFYASPFKIESNGQVRRIGAVSGTSSCPLYDFDIVGNNDVIINDVPTWKKCSTFFTLSSLLQTRLLLKTRLKTGL